MRVLQICDTYPPDEGGLGSHVRRLAGHLVTRGHEVAVVAPGKERVDALDDGGFSVHRIALSLARVPGAYEPTSPPFHPPWPDPSFVRGLRSVATDFAPEVVHTHGWCVHSAISRRSPSSQNVLTTLHDYGLNCPKKSLLRFGAPCGHDRGVACLRCNEQTLAKRAGLAAALGVTTPPLKRRVKKFLAVSRHVASQAERIGVPAAAVEVVPNFVDIPHPTTDEKEADATPYLLYVGPASPHKGRQVLLDAHRRIESDVVLRLVGGDSSISAPGVEDLGFKSGDELADLFRQAIALIVPSIWADPCPTVALEAMAQGTPVIASDIGGLAEIVEDGTTGLLVPAEDVDRLSAALNRLVSDPALCASMGESARRRAQDFSSATVLPQIEAAYDDVKVGG
jgi:glycosyltransferase involved in cell wall biosynthesis